MVPGALERLKNVKYSDNKPDKRYKAGKIEGCKEKMIKGMEISSSPHFSPRIVARAPKVLKVWGARTVGRRRHT